MAIFRLSELKSMARRQLGYTQKAEELLIRESKQIRSSYDIFLSHSFRDAEAIYGIKVAVEEMGYKVYVDWVEDSHLDREKVTKDTAQLLKSRMKSSLCLFYATSENARVSKWMPWELGYFDGLKDKVAIFPVQEDENITDVYDGPAYLGLYPYITKSPFEKKLRVHFSKFESKGFDEWLGKNDRINVSAYTISPRYYGS